MTTNVKSLEDLKDLGTKAKVATDVMKAEDEKSESQANQVSYKSVKDKLGRSYATGKRKDSVARVWIKAGKGSIFINGKDVKKYFTRAALQLLINQPLATSDREKSFDIIATVKGGGLSGQAGAVRHGISKALCLFEPELRPVLKKSGFITRDSRVVERKKYGKRKARRSQQFSKR